MIRPNIRFKIKHIAGIYTSSDRFPEFLDLLWVVHVANRDDWSLFSDQELTKIDPRFQEGIEAWLREGLITLEKQTKTKKTYRIIKVPND